MTRGGGINVLYFKLRTFLGQMVVSPFLFYSGYGVMESILNKGKPYIKNMPKNRILQVLFNLDMAVVLFLLVRFLQGKTYNAKHILLTLIGWNSIGNSNWYILAILVLYLATFLAFWALEDDKAAIFGVAVITLFFVFFNIWMKRPNYCYNTAFTYLAGILYSKYKKQIEKIIFATNKSYFFSLLILILGFMIAHKYWWKSLFCYELVSVLFALIIVVVTAKIKLTNPILTYAGRHVFSLYMLQRLPMLLLQKTKIANPVWLYFSVSLAITFVISALFDWIVPKLWKLISGKKY